MKKYRIIVCLLTLAFLSAGFFAGNRNFAVDASNLSQQETAAPLTALPINLTTGGIAGFAWFEPLASFFGFGDLQTQTQDRSKKRKMVSLRPTGNSTSLVNDTPFLTEDFSYSAGALTTVGSAAGWNAHSGAGTNAIQVTSPGLTFTGYAGSGVGNAVTLTTSGEDDNLPFTSVSSGTVYAAFMVNVSSSTTTGDYFFHYMVNSTNTTNFDGKVFIKKDASTSNYSFGVSKNANAGTGAVFTAATFAPGTTHLLVVKYTFNSATTVDDTVALFVDPTPGTAEPAATLTATDAAANSDLSAIGGVAIRQGTAANAPAEQIDGIRVGTTWASVVGSGSPTPTPTPTATPTPGPTELVGDGGFEDVANSWPLWTTQTSTNFGSPICTLDLCGADLAFEGNGFLWFGDLLNAATENASVGQSITIPAGSTATLTFEFAAVDSLTPFTDTMLVKMDGTTIKTFTEPAVPDTAYSLQTIDVSAFADGNSHALLFTYSSPDGKSGFLVDNVSLTAVVGGATPTPTPAADLAITKTDGVTTVTPGGSTTYTITASNAGPSAVTGANVADTFPASLTDTWTCVGAGGGTCTAAGAGNINDTVNLPVGGSITYTASATISAAATGTLSNTATVTAPAGTTDPTLGNNSGTDNDTLTPQADLAITKTDGVTTVTAGGSVTYTITASNAGPSNVTGATVADTFPASVTATWTCAGAGGGTCTAAGAGNINDSTVNLPAGGSVTYTATALISVAATGTLSNTATVTSSVTDPTPGNNSATDTDTITPVAHQRANVDMNGDGFTDFVQVRGTGSPFSGNSAAAGSKIPRFMGARGRLKYFAEHPEALTGAAQFQEYWYVLDNVADTDYGVAWGDAATDWNVPADYDGDGRTDVAIWRTGAAGDALFYIIRSSDFTVTFQNIGQEGDDPTVVADYDGDGIDDMAVFSCPASLGPCSFNYIGTKDNPSGSVTSVSWGTGTPGSIFPIAGDYDGDKKADFCVYREDPAIPGQGQYALHKSDGSPDEFVDWGLFNEDIIVPGDYDGDGKADFMVIRDTHPQYVFYLLTRTGQVSSYNWGVTGDVPTPGDYDGDGKTDVAVWRPSVNLSEDWFYVINSHNGSVQARLWGQCTTAPCDEPVADWQVH